MINSKIVFVCGNGRSREGLDLQKLKDIGILVGCNRFYTEIDPHIICALDEPMRKEILEHNLTASYLGSIAEPFFNETCQRNMTRRNINYAYKNGVIDLSEAMKHYPTCCYNSGVVGIIIASWLENVETIYLLGFDFHHPGDIPINNNLHNEQYSKRPKKYEDQMNQVFRACNQSVEIIAVNQPGDEEFHAKLQISRLITYEEFNKLIE